MKLLLCLQLLLTTSGNTNRFGTKVDARTLTKQQFDDVWAGGQNFPTVLTHVYGDLHLDDWCKSLIERCGNTDIEYDVRFSQTGQVESYVAPFADFIAALPEQSDHDESSYLMTEDLLQRDALRGLAAQLPHPEWLFGPDLFLHFPATVRPQQALIVGGCGARSFLHADPYEWVGTNLLLEGRKLWTFFSPDVPAELFHARRNAPDAWGSFNVSAGWVSHDVDLYRHRQSIPLGALVYYALKQARAGAGAAAEGRNEGLEQLMRTTLAGAWLEAALSAQAPASGAVGDVKRHLDMPLFLSGDDRVDRCADPRLQRGCVQIVQEPGDMILIPPNYWHQVYHLEPSVAVASQYCSPRGKRRVFSHVLRWCANGEGADGSSGTGLGDHPLLAQVLREAAAGAGAGPGNTDSGNASDSDSDSDSERDKAEVLAVLRAALRLQHGADGGDRLMQELLEKEGNAD